MKTRIFANVDALHYLCRMIVNQETIEFVREHRNDDVRMLALKNRTECVDMNWALEQIQGWQTARKKLPSWSTVDDIVYPPHLSMEQCSSEATARYKCSIIERMPASQRKTLIDLTGGFGVDFAFMAQQFERAIYVERQEQLCETAKHNFKLLGLTHALVEHAEAEDTLNRLKDNSIDSTSTIIYLDPARRDCNSARTYAIEDCTPNVLELLPQLLATASHVLLKLSPMLDWHKTIIDLGQEVNEVHIVSTVGECKELLVLLENKHTGEPSVYCVNDEDVIAFKPSEENETANLPAASATTAQFLYEPNASIMKAGCFGVIAKRYGVAAIATDSHLYVSDTLIEDFPGRAFRISAVSSMNKKELRHSLLGIDKANVAVRNFPLSAQELRKRLKLGDGGDCYIFGTTSEKKEHILFICQRITKQSS